MAVSIYEVSGLSGHPGRAILEYVPQLVGQLGRFDFRKFLEQLNLFLVEILRCFDENLNDLITADAAPQRRYTLIGETEDVPGLGCFGNFQTFFASQGGNLYGITEGGLDKRNLYLAYHVRIVAGEIVVRTNIKEDVQVTGWTAACTGFSLSVQSEP